MLSQLWNSAVQFRDRFSLYGGLEAKLRKTHEETYEFFQAIQEYRCAEDYTNSQTTYDNARQNILKEFIDIQYAGFGALLEMGFTLPEIEEAIKTIIDKNDKKTLLTHELRDGYVRKKNEGLAK